MTGMPPAILLSLALHHGEAADPELLIWIKQRLDLLLGLGPWTIVALVAMLIVAFPVALVLFYVVQNRRPGNEA